MSRPSVTPSHSFAARRLSLALLLTYATHPRRWDARARATSIARSPTSCRRRSSSTRTARRRSSTTAGPSSMSPPPTAGPSKGMQGRWTRSSSRSREDQLIGYRAYDYAPGTAERHHGRRQQQGRAGGLVQDQVALRRQARIQRRHRRADERHHARTPRIVPGSAREFMRVDWSTDKLANPLMDVSLQLGPFRTGTGPANVGNVAISEADITNPGRAIFTKDYLDVTRAGPGDPDYVACCQLVGARRRRSVGLRPGEDRAAPLVPGGAGVSEYEPLEYPDRQPLLDADGKPISRGLDGRRTASPATAPTCARPAAPTAAPTAPQVGADQFAKFGYFRTVRQYYDRRLGATELTAASTWPTAGTSGRRPSSATARAAPLLDDDGQSSAHPRGSASAAADPLLHERRVPRRRPHAAATRPSAVVE